MDVYKNFKKEMFRVVKKYLEHETIGVKKGQQIKSDEIVNVCEKIIEIHGNKSQNSFNENGALPIQHVIPILHNIHNMLDIDFNKQTDKNKELMSDIVEMCQAIVDDYWMYKRL